MWIREIKMILIGFRRFYASQCLLLRSNQFLKRMKQNHYPIMRFMTLLALTSVAAPAYCIPETPVGIKAEVKGLRVDLSWNNSDAGETLLDCSFEDENFPPEGWSQKVTNNYEYLCSWFHYPSDDFKKLNNWQDYVHSGEKSAMVYFDMFGLKGDHNAAQDEWLITPAVKNAAYVDLHYYIDPVILEYGADDSFPEHYYVKASYDNGTTWDVLWDARYEARPTTGWHNLVLPLKGGDAPMVAFQGVSDSGDMIHLLWVIDDVKMLSSKSGSDIVDGYTIKLDGQTIAEHVKSLDYSDVSLKEAGVHRYEIFAESAGTLSAAGEIEVTIEEIDLLPPANVKVTGGYDEEYESYLINISWDAPQGGVIDPVYYNVYCDDMEVATMLEDLSIDFFGYSRGVYDFRVSAVYENPDGESEPVGERIAVDTRFNARNLRATISDSGSVTLKWDAPEKSDCEVSHYQVWRADKCVAQSVTEPGFIDKDVPAGYYRYYVETFYTDGESSIPAYTDVYSGEGEPRPMPYTENFDSGHMPADWFVENLWDNTPDNMLWQFNDPTALGVTGEGFDKGFASIDSNDSGFYLLAGALTSPSIDVSGCDYNKLVISFTYDYASDGESSTAILEIERNGDGKWIPVYELIPYNPDETNGFMPVKETIGLADEAGGASTIRARWNYNGVLDRHLAIDNVMLYDASAGTENVNTDSFTLRPTADGITVSATEGIATVEVYAVDGRLLNSVQGNGATELSVTIDNSSLCIVKITTASTTRSFKLAK